LFDELVKGLVLQVPKDGLLALFPGLVQRTGSACIAGAVLHDAAGYAEGSLDGFYGVPESYLPGRASETGSSASSLLALDQTSAGEVCKDAGQQAAWTWASAEILSAVARSPNQARYIRARRAYRPSLLNSSRKHQPP
jgi:hypothetical protein